MDTCVFDLETSSLFADTGILLCSVIKKYGDKDVTIVRADQFKQWKTCRSNTKPCVIATLKALRNFDIYVAHNGQWFDKPMLTSWALKFNQYRLSLRFEKFVDPVLLARRHMRVSRRSLGNLLQFLQINEEKTAILWEHWMKATLDGNTRSLDYIVEHCVTDVIALEKAYAKVKGLVKQVDHGGSSF